MVELTLDEVLSRLNRGCNPVEVAGYGRESTHKGYLTWLLNTSRWPKAKEGLIRLVETAISNDAWSDDYRRKAEKWVQQCPDTFYCEYEQKVEKGKIDLFIKGEDGSNLLPIELKTDGSTGGNQLSAMSSAPLESGLVLLLGSSAVRDDAIPQDTTERGCFAPLTIGNILTAWEEMDMPGPGRDWLEALEHEQIRLHKAFDLNSENRQHAYRNEKHMFFALLNSARKILNEKYDHVGTWQLYDGGHNTVLNLRDSKWSWKKVAKNNAYAFWEFNDCKLVLKVKQCGTEEITRRWVEETQKKIQMQEPLNGFEGKKPTKKARNGSTWISIWRWQLPFDTAGSVAELCIKIIKHIQPVLSEE